MVDNKLRVARLLRDVYRIKRDIDPEIYNEYESKIYELITEIQEIYTMDERKIYLLIKEIQEAIDEDLLNDQLELVSNIFDN